MDSAHNSTKHLPLKWKKNGGRKCSECLRLSRSVRFRSSASPSADRQDGVSSVSVKLTLSLLLCERVDHVVNLALSLFRPVSFKHTQVLSVYGVFSLTPSISHIHTGAFSLCEIAWMESISHTYTGALWLWFSFPLLSHTHRFSLSFSVSGALSLPLCVCSLSGSLSDSL